MRVNRWLRLMAWGVACLCAGPAVAGKFVDLARSDARVTLDHVVRADHQARDGDSALQAYVFQPAEAPRLMLVPAQGTWDWQGQGELRLRVQNGMDWAVTLRIDIEGAAPGQALHATVGVPAGPAQTVVVPLRATSPRTEGMQVGPPMPYGARGQRWLVALTVEGELDLRRVAAVRIGVPEPKAAQTMLFGQAETVPGDTAWRDAYTAIVDRYGQYVRGQWPEKVASDEALRAAQAHAQAAVAAMASRARSDRYGGRRGRGRAGGQGCRRCRHRSSAD